MSATPKGGASKVKAEKKFAFQDEFPADCPPKKAVSREGTFYACHRDNPPGNTDFSTAAQRASFIKGCPCRRLSNSVMGTIEDARGLLKAYPQRYKYVSRGIFKKTDGRWAPSPSASYKSHHSLWRYENVGMHEIFVDLV